MATRIQASQIQNLQQIEAVVAGPDDANRLFIISGQATAPVSAFSPTTTLVQQSESFTLLVGPVFTRRQLIKAIATANVSKAFISVQAVPAGESGWSIGAIDADWDDESGQVELRVEVVVTAIGVSNRSSVTGVGFQVTILAAIAG